MRGAATVQLRSKQSIRCNLLLGLILCTAWVVGSSALAHAHIQEEQDARDSQSLAVDIQSLALGHSDDEVVIAVRTFKAWNPKDLGFLQISFDSREAKYFDRYADVGRKNGEWVAKVRRMPSGKAIGPIKVEKLGQRTIRISFKSRFLGINKENVRWDVNMQDSCYCHGKPDRAPSSLRKTFHHKFDV